MNSATIKTTILLTILLLMPMAGCAADDGRDNRRQGPPPEAIKACEGKQEGDKVTFAGRGGESLSATCQSIGDQMAAVPEGHKGRQ